MASLNDKDRADLVAYLDGELDAGTARAMEAKLSLDPQARAEAVALRKTWELLDFLPRAEPSPQFTHRTLERLSAQGLATISGRGRWPGWIIGAGWAAAVLLAAGAGFASMHYLTRPPVADQITDNKDGNPKSLDGMDEDSIENSLVFNLRVLENKRLYENVDDMKMLHKLDDPDLFGEVEVD